MTSISELRNLKPDDTTIEDEEDGVFDIRVSNELYNKLKVAEYISLFFAVVSVGLAMLLFEMQNLSDEGVSIEESSVLVYNAFCTIGLILSIYIRYDLYH